MLIAGIRGASANTQEAEWLQKKERGRKGKDSFQGGSDVLVCLVHGRGSIGIPVLSAPGGGCSHRRWLRGQAEKDRGIQCGMRIRSLPWGLSLADQKRWVTLNLVRDRALIMPSPTPDLTAIPTTSSYQVALMPVY